MFYLIGCKKNFKQYRPNTWLPSLIRYFADIEFNHIIFQDSKKNNFTEAIADGVCMNYSIYGLSTHKKIIVIETIINIYKNREKINYI